MDDPKHVPPYNPWIESIMREEDKRMREALPQPVRQFYYEAPKQRPKPIVLHDGPNRAARRRAQFKRK